MNRQKLLRSVGSLVSESLPLLQPVTTSQDNTLLSGPFYRIAPWALSEDMAASSEAFLHVRMRRHGYMELNCGEFATAVYVLQLVSGCGEFLTFLVFRRSNPLRGVRYACLYLYCKGGGKHAVPSSHKYTTKPVTRQRVIIQCIQ